MRAVIVIVTLFILFSFILIFVGLNTMLQKKLFNPIRLPTSYSAPRFCSIHHLRDGVVVMSSRKGSNILVFFHGQFGNQLLYDKLMSIRDISDTQIVIVDYPGFGLSLQEQNIKAFLRVHKTVADYIDETWEFSSYDNITVWGESLGGNPAIKFSCDVEVDKLVLASTFVSLTEMINPGMKEGPLGLILTDTLNNIELVKRTKASRVYIIHSKEDTRIPFKQALMLLKTLEGKSELITIKGDHADPIYDLKAMSQVGPLIYVDDIEELIEIFSYMKRRFVWISQFFETAW